ncbi:hypothetical protein ADIARSV_2194 [Arcticibacter svalbardensis MN12-7]|uniref:Rhamnogalacturonase A/B/Epimerase-like pectate lyase domain-containing protein n=1 Tax=Arcticibacter svalbardensis MN12-7 TaxID=1150600 RepID=R9GSA7_9SPHI|nr:glycosyl hydrolase family 28-related protein [Arcticibacter svalbardensis]EOR94596.1 hypothetical protein ADIARSV_2194 [Arcticibacter svalbardensis MN12-7]
MNFKSLNRPFALLAVIFLTAVFAFKPIPDYQLKRVEIEPEVYTTMKAKWNNDFVHVSYPHQWLNAVIAVDPGESIQKAIDKVTRNGGVVLLKKGTYLVSKPIVLKSKVTIIGEGTEHTIIKQDIGLTDGGAFQADPLPQITDVVISNLSIIGIGGNSKAHGILMAGKNGERHNRIMLQHVDVKNWAGTGVHMKRTDNIVMDACNFQKNGSGNSLYHNVYFLYNKYILQSDCDMSYPVLGKGNKYTSCEFVLAQRCTIKDCSKNGIQSDHEEAGYIFFHKYHVSGCGQVALWFPCENYYDKYNYTEDPKYAPQKVILNRCEIINNRWGALWRSVNNSYVINSVFNNKEIDMGLLKCDVKMENSTFKKGNENYTDVKQWPADVKLLW